MRTRHRDRLALCLVLFVLTASIAAGAHPLLVHPPGWGPPVVATGGTGGRTSAVRGPTVSPSPPGAYLDPLATAQGRISVRSGGGGGASAPLLRPTNPRPTALSIPVGSSPYELAVDTANDRVYVANEGSNNVTVLNATTGATLGAIGVGAQPRSIAVNESAGRLYVTNWGSDNVSVIDTSTDTVLRSVPVGGMPEDVLVDGVNGDVYVTNWQSNNVTVFTCASDTVVKSIGVGTTPTGLVLNPANDEVYVANRDSDNLSVIDGSNNTVIQTVAVAPLSGPVEMVLDPAAGELFVSDWYSNNVTVVNVTTAHVVAELPVGVSPWGIGLDSVDGDLYVANSGASNVSAIGAASEKTVGSVMVGGFPTGLAIDPSTGEVFVANYGSNTVSAIAPTGTFTYVVQFTETGLPAGTNWSVTLNGTTNRSTTYSVNFLEANGRFPFADAASGYLGTPESGNVTVNGSAVGIAITFRPMPYPVTFTESGLPPGDSWSVLLPAFGSSQSTNSSITFRVPDGTWAYSVSAPCVLIPLACWHVSPSSGNVTVRGAPVTVAVSIGLPGEFQVNFVESGLPAFTNWSVTLNGSNEASVTPSITFYERNGTWPYFVLPASRYGISLASGNLTVAGTNLTVPITFIYRVTAPMAYPVTILESGLFAGASGVTVWWQASFDGGTRTISANPLSASSTSSTTFSALNGTYSYVVGAEEPTEAAIPSYGYLTVRGAPVTVEINFTDAGALTCNGLIGFGISGTSVQGSLVSVTGTVDDFSPNCNLQEILWHWGDGSSSSTSSFPAAHAYQSTGKFWIIITTVWTGNWTLSRTLPVTIARAGYDVLFVETGLRPTANWTVDFGGTNSSGAGGRSLIFAATNGTYAFDVGVVPGYLASPACGSVKVAGRSPIESINFTPANGSVFSVSFDERGLIPGTNWSVSLNGSMEATIASAILFQEVNGSFAFVVHAVAGYTVTPTGGSVSLNGRSAVVSVTFTTPNPRPWWLFGLPGFTGYIVWAGAVITVVGGSAVAIHRARLKPPAR